MESVSVLDDVVEVNVPPVSTLVTREAVVQASALHDEQLGLACILTPLLGKST